MTSLQKKLLIGGGVAVGGIALAVLLFGDDKRDDLKKVVDAALVKETDPNVLGQLARAMKLALSPGDALLAKVPLLEDKAARLRTSQTASGETFVHLRQF